MRVLSSRERMCGGIVVFDLKSNSNLATIEEPLFIGFNAKVEFFPVMNVEELQRE